MLGFFGKKTPQLVDRDGERYDVSLRVLSRELPGYRGVTLDLSRSGVQLETSGELEVGSEPELKFEFDRGELDSFTCQAQVVWSRQDGDNQRKFHSGLRFVPKTDDEIRQLSRMATVLQTRSETDLKTLLDQARRIDPDLEESYANISSAPRYKPSPHDPSTPSVLPQGTPPPPPPPPPQSAPAPVAQKKQQTPPNLGLYMPLSVKLEGYTWNCQSRTLHLGIREGDAVHSLFFPDCQLFQVLEPAADTAIEGLYSTFTSPKTRKLQFGETQTRFKHYRFVGSEGKGLIDIVSGPCRSKA